MSYVLYGSGPLLKKAYAYLCEAYGAEAVFSLEDVVDGVVLSEKLPEAQEAGAEEIAAADAVILAAENAWMSYALRRIAAAGASVVCYLPYYYALEGYEISDDSFIGIDPTLPRLEYLEYHISGHCNLKCKGCTHFSNILTREVFGDLEQFGRDMLRLQELFWGIYKIRLLGGEPLLNPELPHFVAAARSAFPDADIRVVSNGLLLREDMEDLLDTMAACEAGFDVSMYPPTKAAIGRMDSICRAKGVSLYVTPEVTEFYAKMDPDGKQDPAAVYPSCPARHCAFLGAGVISTCAMPQLLPIFCESFGKEMPELGEDIIDLYEEGLSGEELKRRLQSPMKSCRFCTPGQRSFPWQPAGPQVASAEDWRG
ncbi:MAG: radical SAM protein [Lachnospiraceae bacterium]|nr:radical SAM protein [Lachnospiraceae bacterium]